MLIIAVAIIAIDVPVIVIISVGTIDTDTDAVAVDHAIASLVTLRAAMIAVTVANAVVFVGVDGAIIANTTNSIIVHQDSSIVATSSIVSSEQICSLVVSHYTV